LSSADLIRNADIAMYDAKRRGRARHSVFDATMHRGIIDRLAAEVALRRAVEGALLRIHYQPIIELSTGCVSGLEALARWPEDWDPVEPTEFIAIAEDTGVIDALGRHVTAAALATLADWRQQGLVSDQVCMSVNLSGRQLDDPGLARQVHGALKAADLPAEVLKLEITESTLIREVERSQQLFALGCEYGQGYLFSPALSAEDMGTWLSSWNPADLMDSSRA
jgi:EAL domain-containing protein (putative c-di-GMP-specific phosphodiesterase class I)